MIYWLIHILILGILSFAGFRFIKSTIPPFIYWTALSLKLIAGLILGYIFFEYYEYGDTITFFEVAKNSDTIGFANQPRDQFFVKLIRPIVLISGNSYWITSLWLSLISFLSSWYTTTVIVKLYPNIRFVVMVCFLFIPSTVFWSSGMMKNTLAFASMSILIAFILRFYRNHSLTIFNILLMILSGFLLFHLKHYLFISVLLFGGILLSLHFFICNKGFSRWIIPISIGMVSIVSTQFIHPYLTFNRIPQTLYENNRTIILNSDVEDRLNLVVENDSWTALISQVPRALHIGLFRPSIFDKTPSLGWVHKIENLILATLISLSILLLLKLRLKPDWPLLVAALSCILLLAVMLPLSSPNLGTLVRYKNAYMPYLFLISSILPYRFLTSQTVD